MDEMMIRDMIDKEADASFLRASSRLKEPNQENSFFTTIRRPITLGGEELLNHTGIKDHGPSGGGAVVLFNVIGRGLSGGGATAFFETYHNHLEGVPDS